MHIGIHIIEIIHGNEIRVRACHLVAFMRHLLILHIQIVLLLLIHSKMVLQVLLATSLVLLHVDFFNVLLLRLWRDEKGVGLMLLVLLHFLPTDVGALLENNANEVL